jgi:hypothetical protein
VPVSSLETTPTSEYTLGDGRRRDVHCGRLGSSPLRIISSSDGQHSAYTRARFGARVARLGWEGRTVSMLVVLLAGEGARKRSAGGESMR